MDLFGDPKGAQASILKAAAQETEWWPTLRVRGQTIQAKSIKATGELNDTPAAAQSNQGRMGSALGGLNALGGALGGGTPKVRSTLTAQWLEFKSTGPGTAPHAETRIIWDGIGPAARERKVRKKTTWTKTQKQARGLAMGTHIDLLVMGAAPAPELALRKGVEHLVSAGPPCEHSPTPRLLRTPRDLTNSLRG